jgi:uncharacterized protein
LRLAILLLTGLGALYVGLCLVLGYTLLHPPRIAAGAAMARGWYIDPADAGYEAREWTFETRDGLRLPVWEVINAGQPDGPVVIFSHCWGGSRRESLQRVGFVIDRASRVILWDLRGHGEAGGTSRLGTLEVDDLHDLMDKVAGDAPVILYGYSMGAGVSIWAAACDERPDRVIGVIADGPYRWTREPVHALLLHNGLPSFPVLNTVHRALCVLIPRLRNSERAQFAARLRCPLLVLHGADDPVCPLNSALEVAQAAPESEFIIIPAGGHLNLHQTDAHRYHASVDDFIRRCMEHRATKQGLA